MNLPLDRPPNAQASRYFHQATTTRAVVAASTSVVRTRILFVGMMNVICDTSPFEVFSPVVCVLPFDDDDQVMARANDTAYARCLDLDPRRGTRAPASGRWARRERLGEYAEPVRCCRAPGSVQGARLGP